MLEVGGPFRDDGDECHVDANKPANKHDDCTLCSSKKRRPHASKQRIAP